MELYKPLIEKTIKTIINQFHRKPYNFFNEHEFHQYCYYVFYSKKEFSKQFTTLDDKKTNILHPEYPTVKRFERCKPKPKCYEPNVKKGVRARYDMAILNPNFIKSNKMCTIINRDIRLASRKKDNLIAAMEFKFIIKHDEKFRYEIGYDFFKLSNAKEVNLKYMLIFANTIEKEIPYFEDLDKNKDVKIIYVAVYEENNKKKIKIIK